MARLPSALQWTPGHTDADRFRFTFYGPGVYWILGQKDRATLLTNECALITLFNFILRQVRIAQQHHELTKRRFQRDIACRDKSQLQQKRASLVNAQFNSTALALAYSGNYHPIVARP